MSAGTALCGSCAAPSTLPTLRVPRFCRLPVERKRARRPCLETQGHAQAIGTLRWGNEAPASGLGGRRAAAGQRAGRFVKAVPGTLGRHPAPSNRSSRAETGSQASPRRSSSPPRGLGFRAARSHARITVLLRNGLSQQAPPNNGPSTPLNRSKLAFPRYSRHFAHASRLCGWSAAPDCVLWLPSTPCRPPWTPSPVWSIHPPPDILEGVRRTSPPHSTTRPTG